MHLQRAVAGTDRGTPLTIADHLDFLVTGGFDVQFDQRVLVVAHAGGLHFLQYFFVLFGCFLGRCCDAIFQFTFERRRGLQNPLPLAAATADGFQTHAVFRVLAEYFCHANDRFSADFFHADDVDALAVRSVQHGVCSIFQAHGVGEVFLVHLQAVVGGDFLQAGTITHFTQQRQHGDVVDTRRGGYVVLQCGTLGFILSACATHSARAGSDKGQAGRFERAHQRFVFRHETVTGKDGVVTVFLGDRDDLLDALGALFLVGAGVIRHPVHAIRIGQLTQLRCQCVVVGDGVFFRQQDAVLVDTHRIPHVHHFFTDGATADDQRLHVGTVELTHPGGIV